jgi:hypothetical protein
MLTTSSHKGGMKPEARSRKTNGKSIFLGKVDGRSVIARRYRDLERAYSAELGGNLSLWQQVKVSQAASLTVRAEQIQSAIAAGHTTINDEDLVRVANALRRELVDLGLDRNPTPARPDLGTYLKCRGT